MEKKIKSFSVFDVQGERFKASSLEEYKEKSDALANKIYSSRILLEEELICSYPYYKQLLAWAELIASKEIDITDILAKGKYSNTEKATKKIALVSFIKLLKDFLKAPSISKKHELCKRFDLIKLRRDSLNNVKNGILSKRIQCSKEMYEKIVFLNDIIEDSCGKMTGMYMPYAINLANKRGVRYDSEGNAIGSFVDDYIQAACIGLYEAAKHFDPTKNISFTTYAWYWMVQGFGDVLEKSEMIRFPRNILLLKNKITKTSQETVYTSLSGLSEKYGQTQKAIKKALDCNKTISLERPSNAQSEEDNLLADLSDGHSVEMDAEKNSEREILLGIIKNTLTPREQKFIYMRFGFLDNEPHTLKSIAVKMGMTTEGARQATKNALLKIIPEIVKQLGVDYGEQDTEKVLALCSAGKQ